MPNIAGVVAGIIQSILALFGAGLAHAPQLPPPVQPAAQATSTPAGASANQAQRSASAPSSCALYANLKKGDTDATTNGEVSKLQAFLGIAPATGYYGAQTGIGYQNKCGNLGNAQPMSVPGMSKYTDANFGFSFWYPSAWYVRTITTPLLTITGATLEKELVVSPSASSNGTGNQDIVVQEYYSADEAIEDGNGMSGPFRFYFDASVGAWMETSANSNSGGKLADVSRNTMGGLHVLSLVYPEVAIPLSAQKFVVVGGYYNHRNLVSRLTDTIVATNPNVATPISTAKQLAAIRMEASVYGVPVPTASQRVEIHQSSLQASAGVASIRISGTAHGVSDPLVLLYGANHSMIAQNSAIVDAFGNWSTTLQPINTPTFLAGNYVVSVYDGTSGPLLTAGTLVVSGSSSSPQTYTNSQYGFSVHYPAAATIMPCQRPGDWVPPGICDANPLVMFDNVIGVFASSDARTVAYCDAGQAGTTPTSETINGIPFSVSRETDLGAGSEHENISYATLRGGVCYSISADITGATIGFDDSKATNELTAIVKGFTFTQ